METQEKGLLAGKELEGKIGDVGGYYVDVTKEGKVEFSLEVKKEFEGGQVSSTNKAQVDLLHILELQAKKSGKPWTETVVSTLRMTLGLVG